MTFIYIIRCDKQNLFKIGISNNVDKRLKQLQTGNPYKLKCIYKIKSLEIKASKIEATIHQFLKEANKKHVLNEWFNLSDDEVFNLAKCLNKFLMSHTKI